MTEKSSVELLCEDITENYKLIQQNIETAAAKSGRAPEDITFMAVTKTVQPVFINHALGLGIQLIGENKVQELLSKIDFLDNKQVSKHIIGHLQTNKVKKIISVVDMIESVDSLNLAREISKHATAENVTMKILLEVNIGNEASKTGLPEEQVMGIAREIADLPGICLKGLMCVPPVCENSEDVRPYFQKTKALYERLKDTQPFSDTFDTLSMGMSGDYSLAIEEGATLVRVGSALFGARRY